MKLLLFRSFVSSLKFQVLGLFRFAPFVCLEALLLELGFSVCHECTNIKKIQFLKFQIPKFSGLLLAISALRNSAATIGFGWRPEASGQKGDPEASGPYKNSNCLTR